MEKHNTLFLVAKHGLKKGAKPGLLESWMWNLTQEEEHMPYVSLHKSKSVRAHKGGRIIEIRAATDRDVKEHQDLLSKLGKEQMHEVTARRIIVFEVVPEWDKLWPKNARHNPMAYKATGYLVLTK